jgi:NAD(P)-dependent dehydrogenase (short-subunit alcohol dehydrogenase family)
MHWPRLSPAAGRTRLNCRTLLAAALVAGVCASGHPSGLSAQSGAAERDSSADSARRVMLVTGSTDGLGREVARRLAATGAHVIVHGRNQERGTALVAEITRAGGGSAAFYAADLASFDEVRTLANALLRDYDRIDVLVNNAGIWLNRSAERSLSDDGHELHLAVNYLSGYLLTHLLMPRIIGTTGARIVNVASAAQAPIDFDNVMLARGYSGGRAYAQSKLAQVMFTFDLAEELAHEAVTVAALHPATLMDTPMVREAGARPRSTIAEGADAVIHLVLSPDIRSGQYYNGREPARAHAQAYDSEARRRLRALSVELTGAH